MPFPVFDTEQKEGAQFIHPVTKTKYQLGPNGVWQKLSARDTLVDTDQFDSRYLKLSGGDMTGSVLFSGTTGTGWNDDAGERMGHAYRSGDSTVQYTAYNGKKFKLTAKDSDGNSKTFVDVQNTDSSGSEGTDYRMQLYHVATPTGTYHAANRKYVDQCVADHRQRTWKYKSGGGTPGAGEFTVSGTNYIRLHHTTYRGMPLSFSSPFNEDLNNGSTNFAKLAFTAWKVENGKAQGKFFIWVGWFYDTSGYFELKDLSSTDKTDCGLEGTKEYELHLAGFF